MGVTDAWFLSRAERDNAAAAIDDGRETAYTEGNDVRLLVHGAAYFHRLREVVDATSAGDRVWFTDWRGDADEQLEPDGPTVEGLLRAAVERGVEVRGLLWRSHSDRLTFSGRENSRLGAALNASGGEALLDQRVRRGGSHHQKLFVVGRRGRPAEDVAFVGGIDLSHSRRDDACHHGDPQQQPMNPAYGATAPWHDAAVEIRGPAVRDVLRSFVERWDDPTPLDHGTPYRMAVQRLEHMPRHPSPLPEPFDDPPPLGPHAVQVLRTYPAKRPPYPFAPDGERSVARAYAKAFRRARRLVYVEDQYLWSRLVADTIAEALERAPGLRVVAVVPRCPDDAGRLSAVPARVGQLRAIQRLQQAAGDRVAVYDLENDEGVPIYVHAKVCVVDDVWVTCGSDNFNRRSWTHDSELTVAVVDETRDAREPRDPAGLGDGARTLARDVRLTLWAEHLGTTPDDPRLLDPDAGFALFAERARALDEWHRGGRRGERPPGQVRVHDPGQLSRSQRLWAPTIYRLLHDPDGRPLSRRVSGTF